MAAAATVRPCDSASTNAACAASTTRVGAPSSAAAEPRPSTTRSRAPPVSPGSDCSRSLRPTVATSAPSAATPNVPPIMRNMESVPEATPALLRSTEFIAAMLIGDMIRPRPRPMSTKPGHSAS